MTPERYDELMSNDLCKLSDDEYKSGWHFCFEFDGLLVGPGMPEMECCKCPHCVTNSKPKNSDCCLKHEE